MAAPAVWAVVEASLGRCYPRGLGDRECCPHRDVWNHCRAELRRLWRVWRSGRPRRRWWRCLRFARKWGRWHWGSSGRGGSAEGGGLYMRTGVTSMSSVRVEAHEAIGGNAGRSGNGGNATLAIGESRVPARRAPLGWVASSPFVVAPSTSNVLSSHSTRRSVVTEVVQATVRRRASVDWLKVEPSLWLLAS